MIGGGGEQKTLRLVAQYGDACNVGWGNPESIVHKLEVLRGHCDALGRPYDEIERTTLVGGVRVAEGGGERMYAPQQLVDYFGELGDAGIQHVLLSVRDVWQTDQLELFGSAVIPALRDA
jgi:alkanesulfonate monooxygenase